jgi:leader peptidase (prepilin peptidase)/N-methyltransferase
MQNYFIYLFSASFLFLIGASIGSFLNVVAYRLPRGISLFLPRSHCPHCQAPVKILYLIPTFGYFLTHKKCAYCRAKIPPLYPLIETLSGLACVLVFLWPPELRNLVHGDLTKGEWEYILVTLFLFYTFIPVSVIDIERRIIPNKLVAFITLVGLSTSVIRDDLPLIESILGLLGGFFLLFTFASVYKLLRGQEGLGMGDIKYLGALGTLIGFKGVIMATMMGSILASVIGIFISLRTKEGLSLTLPFGPFLGFGALCSYVFSYYYYGY